MAEGDEEEDEEEDDEDAPTQALLSLTQGRGEDQGEEEA